MKKAAREKQAFHFPQKWVMLPFSSRENRRARFPTAHSLCEFQESEPHVRVIA